MNKRKHLILGFGYIAPFLKEYILQQEPKSEVITTSRRAGKHVEFDLGTSTTWTNLPKSDVTYWTFPAVPVEIVKDFLDSKAKDLGKLIVIGSTSAFIVTEEHGLVDEESSLDLSKPRVRGEQYLRSQGAVCVMSSGIYGPERNPLDWIKAFTVGKNEKLVNMIHAKDLAQFLYKSSLFGDSGEMYIASDNCPQTWRAVIEKWEDRGLLKNVPAKKSSATSKKINCKKSLDKLKVTLEFQNFSDLAL